MPKFIDITGQKFSMLTVIERSGRDHLGRITWRCSCDCGNTTLVIAPHLKSGNTKACGCLVRDKDISGEKFGRLTALARAGGKYWKFQCECGNEITSRKDHVTHGRTQSCGCYLRDRITEVFTTHGMTGTTEFRIWSSMLSRCRNPNSDHFADYGGRGIKVCDRWQEFSNFLADMGRRPKGLTLDRKDNDKGYEPGNCRWATWIQQANNRRKAKIRNHKDH